MPTNRRRRALEQAKQASTLQLLFRAARLANDRAIARVNAAAGASVFRRAIADLLPHIDFEGVRIGVIAEKVGVTKQAVSKVVAEMAEAGVVEVVPDPADARARLVRFTSRGADAIQHGLGVLADLERELSREIGGDTLRALHAALAALVPALEASARRYERSL
jgi:DNA-binding MarR family transcriptional regulator